MLTYPHPLKLNKQILVRIINSIKHPTRGAFIFLSKSPYHNTSNKNVRCIILKKAVLILSICLCFVLSACTQEPAPTPIRTPEPTPEAEIPGLRDKEFFYKQGNVTLTFPESWIGYYNTEISFADYDIRFYYTGERGELSETLCYLRTGPEVPDGAWVLSVQQNEDDTRTFAYMTWPDTKDAAGRYLIMLDDSRDNEQMLCRAEPTNTTDVTKVFIDAIQAVRTDEDNQYKDIIVDPAEELYLSIMGLTREDVSSFAISTSLMNTQAYNVSIVVPDEGKKEVVLEALEEYVDNIKLSFEYYLEDQYAIADNAVIREIDGKIVLVMCEDAEAIADKLASELAK